MSKVLLTGTNSHRPLIRRPFWLISLQNVRTVCTAAIVLAALTTGNIAVSQEAASSDDGFVYPLAVAVESGATVAEDVLYVVDLELPGIWRIDGDGKTIYAKGSNRFREPLNRPRCIALHPDSGVLVGDSATREVYHIASAGADPKPLAAGRIGVAMALAVSPDEQSIYVGDAEKRAVVVIPISGQSKDEPLQWVARVNARGLSFQDDKTLVAVTPDEESIRAINVSLPYGAKPDAITENAAVTTLLDERAFDYPNGLTTRDDLIYVTDGYGDAVFTVDGSGKATKLLAGDPLKGPVGIAASPNAVWVADPQSKTILAIQNGDVVRTEE